MHDVEDGGHRSREFPEGVEDVLDLQGDTLPELLTVYLCGRSDRPRVFPRTRRIRVEGTAGAEYEDSANRDTGRMAAPR